MSRTINISDKLSQTQPILVIGEKTYPINNSVEIVFKFEELGITGNKGMMEALRMAFGDEAFNELKIEKLSIENFKVLTIAVIALMQNTEYEEAEKRFLKSLG